MLLSTVSHVCPPSLLLKIACPGPSMGAYRMPESFGSIDSDRTPLLNWRSVQLAPPSVLLEMPILARTAYTMDGVAGSTIRRATKGPPPITVHVFPASVLL